MIKILQISDKLFWGFNISVELDFYNSIDELANIIKKELILFLNDNNLLNLKEEAEKLNLHNHYYTKYEELYDTNEKIIYFCSHCCN